jgi:hypothetical protein
VRKHWKTRQTATVINQSQTEDIPGHCTENAGVGGSIPPLGTKDYMPISSIRSIRDAKIW